MTDKIKKQFGVWMDTHHATIVGLDSDNLGFTILGHVENVGSTNKPSEKAIHNQEITLTHKFFKAIAEKMQNIDEIHVTGTGQIQEQFIKFLADTPQYKNAKASESTSNKMSDENLILFMMKHFS